MNKKFTYSILAILLVTSLSVIGTYSYFSATRTTNANKFSVGTLDLDVESNGSKLEPFVIENLGNKVNISGTKTWTIKNTGSLPGQLFLNLQNVVNNENGCNDQEKAADPTCDAPGKLGNLGNIITLKVQFDGIDQVQSTLATDQQDKIGTDWAALSPVILQAGEEKTITAHWLTDGSSYGNEIQGDDTQFDMNFRLAQVITN